MRKIKIIRAAFREIQKLSPGAIDQVYKILRRLSQGDEKHTKPLEGHDNLLRTREGDWRVIWQRENSENLIVIKAGLRGGVYDDAFETRSCDRPIIIEEIIEELLQPQNTPLAENPAYHWNHEQESDWYKFVYSSYRYSPILTLHQRDILDEPLKMLFTQHPQTTISNFVNNTCIVQSAPGTGKTVCATVLACEINQQYGWNTILIVPEALRKDIAEYSEVKQAVKQDNFWLVTFREWLGKINPYFQTSLASPEEELEALQEAARLTRRFKCPHKQEITANDVLLYQAFVLDEANSKQSRNAIFQVNKKRIQYLININKKYWEEKFSFNSYRLATANKLKSYPPAPPFKQGCTLVIVDESQDFMLSELQALIAVCESWAKRKHPTYLWLLGDLNQRIQPTDFDWGQLQLGDAITLNRNYRNSRHILEFANQFWDVAQNITKDVNGKYLPQPTKPENAFEVGEPVRWLECESEAEALEFLARLDRESGQEENRRYLLHNLANAVKVLSPNLSANYNNIVILNAEQAKGREFEACLAFRLFQGTEKPLLSETFQWYTMLTRARSRLLVVVTKEELKRLNCQERNYFEKCDRIDPQTAISWITEFASDVDLDQITDDVQQRLLERCETGHLYWDTYLALELAGVENEGIYKWEKQAIAFLAKLDYNRIEEELKQTENIPQSIPQRITLRCLLLRAMELSWDAVAEASQLKDSDVKEYKRLLESIARDLEAKGLFYEAARVRQLFGDDNKQYHMPFWQEISNAANQSQPLVSLLCQAFVSNFDNFMQTQEKE
jgi:mRNA-degrading endonuclease RelE of RelBE toxin-antitoxin system